jgi:hypothetical protein
LGRAVVDCGPVGANVDGSAVLIAACRQQAHNVTCHVYLGSRPLQINQ